MHGAVELLLLIGLILIVSQPNYVDTRGMWRCCELVGGII